MRTLPLLLLLPGLAGCLTQELSPSWLIDRTRILAVRAEPAEPAPGDTVTFTSLSVDPDQDILVAWTGCVLESSGSFGCDPEQSSFIGLEPVVAPTLAVPADLLDDLEPEQRLEGKNYILTLAALPGDTDLSDPEGFDEEDILEIAYKRMPVSAGGDPNVNPDITDVLLDQDQTVERGATVVVSPGQTYDLDPRLTDASIQTYTFVNSEGVTEERVEQPYFTWYATDGTFSNTLALYPETEISWTAPTAPEQPEIQLWVVVRDRRGGMDWFEVSVVVDDGA